MKVLLDENNYFTGSYCTVGNAVGSIETSVVPMVNLECINGSTAWKYEKHKEVVKTDLDEEIEIEVEWLFDEDRYNYIIQELLKEKPPKTTKELEEDIIRLNNDLNDLTEVVLLESDIDTTENIEL